MSGPPLVRHRTPQGCARAYAATDPEVAREWAAGRIAVHVRAGDGSRPPASTTVPEFLEAVEAWGVWGWLGADGLHYWARPDCKAERLVAFFAHEWGHGERPRRRDPSAEEEKAARFASAARFALRAAVEAAGGELTVTRAGLDGAP